MNKEKFIKLLDQAKEDEYGNLYVIQKISLEEEFVEQDMEGTHRVYFETITTKCDDLIKEFCIEEKEGYELYDRHFVNDDTLECKIVHNLESKGE